jgi:glucose-6-phosphate isomerase
MGKPRVYFEGDSFDNDALADLLELLENNCVDPELREERWGVVVVSKSGATLETAAAYRVFRAEAVRFYGSQDQRLKTLFIPVTGQTSRLRDLSRADGLKDDDVPAIPDNIGGRFSVFTAAGLLPAAVMGLDVRALLLGAASMTRRFLEDGFDRNVVLQYAAVNYLLTKNQQKSTRVLAVWSKKLEALGHWYDQLLSESLGKQGRGPTPMTVVQTRDLHARAQLLQDGPRDKVVNNLVVKGTRHPPIQMSMADRNEDDLNVFNRKTYPDMLDASLRGHDEALAAAARPTAELLLPTLSEHTMGQLMQMLMLATVVEGRLMGVNPYGQPGSDPFKRNMQKVLREPVKKE